MFNVYCPTGWTQAPTFLWRACSFGRARLVERAATRGAAMRSIFMMFDDGRCLSNMMLFEPAECLDSSRMMRSNDSGDSASALPKLVSQNGPSRWFPARNLAFESLIQFALLPSWCLYAVCLWEYFILFYSLGGTRCSLAIATFVQELLPLVNVFPRFFQQHIDLRCSMPSQTATTRSFCLNDFEEPAY